MGALEFAPAIGPKPQQAKKIEIDALVKLASEVLSHRKNLKTTFASASRKNALNDILRVGTSAGGARAKAVIAWNRETNEVRSGQIEAGKGFDYWLLKFDGVTGNKDKELEDPKGYGAIEYAYYLMAKAAGITMSECRLLEEGGRRHFMTRRFDRLDGGEKLHMQSLCALAHFDFNNAGAYAYEQALLVIRQLNLPMATVEEQFRRMVFNIIARNQDDHVKNIAFLMDKTGRWSLAPAFDVIYSYNPTGDWTARHQMTMNGKHDGFTLADFRACAKSALMKRGRAEAIVEEVRAAVAKWPDLRGAGGGDEGLAQTNPKQPSVEFPGDKCGLIQLRSVVRRDRIGARNSFLFKNHPVVTPPARFLAWQNNFAPVPPSVCRGRRSESPDNRRSDRSDADHFGDFSKMVGDRVAVRTGFAGLGDDIHHMQGSPG
jgi:serine/threonine-protein kinase HipA